MPTPEPPPNEIKAPGARPAPRSPMIPLRELATVRTLRVAAIKAFRAVSRVLRAAPAGRRRAAGLVLSALLAAAGTAAAAEIVVVAHPDLPVDALSAGQLRNVFVGELTFVGRVKVLPVGYEDSSTMSDGFLRAVVGMDSRRYRVYWIKEVFHSGRVPPRMVQGVDEMLRIVATEPGAIGYVPAERLEGVSTLKRLYTVSVP